MFEATFIAKEVRHQYGFLVDQVRVLEEWLFAWPKGRRQSWLERDKDRFSFGERLRGENRVVEQVTRQNALFLSTAAQHQHEQLLPVYDWFRRLQTIRIEGYKERYADAMPAAASANSTKQRKQEAEAEAKRQKDQNLAFDEVWCVHDIDDHPKLEEARVTALDNGIELAIQEYGGLRSRYASTTTFHPKKLQRQDPVGFT
jgi:hypothetical protein